MSTFLAYGQNDSGGARLPLNTGDGDVKLIARLFQLAWPIGDDNNIAPVIPPWGSGQHSTFAPTKGQLFPSGEGSLE